MMGTYSDIIMHLSKLCHNFVFCHESRSSTLSTWSPVTELPTPLSFLLHNDLGGGGINLVGKGYIRRQPGDIRGGEHSP